MAMSRAEIELLIKARNEAQGAFDQLNNQIKGVTGESDRATTGMENLGARTRDTGAGATAASVAFGILAERIGRGLVTAFQDTIEAANRLDAGLIGLRSVATAFKQDAQGAEEAAKKLASDGLLSVGDAATALKNLLAAGFGLPEAIELVNRFKDSAAFGRQGALDFGQAVTSATEGIKNGNSILVDNAGVTKNLSQILVEAGFAATDLSKASSDVNIRMALYNGILKETNPQLGDAARFLETAAGKQAQFSAQVEIAQQKIGKELQPALAGVLAALTPLLQVLGDFAPVIVPLGVALAGVAAPIIAIKSASLLGIGSLADLRGAFTLTAASAGTTSTALNLLATAQRGILLAGIVTAAYQAASALGDWAAQAHKTADESGLLGDRVKDLAGIVVSSTNPVSVMKRNWDDITESWGLAKVAAENLIGTMDQLPKVTDGMGDSFKDASGNIHLAENAMQRWVRLHTNPAKPATIDQLMELTRSFDDASRAVETSRARVEGWKGEIQQVAARGALPELKHQLDLGVLSTKELSKEFHLSEDAVQFLKKGMKDAADATKEHERATKAAADAQKHLQQELEKTGVITQSGLNEKLERLKTLLDLAARQGTPALATAVRNLNDEFEDLRKKATDSGLSVEKLDKTFKDAATSAGVLIEPVQKLNNLWTEYPIAKVDADTKEAIQTAHDHQAAIERVNEAYKAFGLQTPQELQKAADKARENYQVLVDSGTATTQQLKDAYKQMIDAQKAATGELPSFWETNVFPGIRQTVERLQTAVEGSFAQMLLGAKGFGEGFKDIWESLKASVLQILNDILGAFINSFLKGLLGALSGQQGAFSAAFGNLFGGGGGFGGGFPGVPGVGGGGGLGGLLGRIPGLGAIFGGAPAIGSQIGLSGGLGLLPVSSFTTTVTPLAGVAGAGGAGAGGAAGGGLLGGGLLSGILGGAGAAGAGGLLGLLGQRIFGGAGAGAAAFGGASGFGTGALIGSVVPGIGTLVGGGIGALAGVLGGLLGVSKKERQGREVVGDVEDELIGTLNTQQLIEAGGERWKQVVIAVRDIYQQTGRTAEQALADVDKLWKSSKDGPDAARRAAEAITKAYQELNEQQQKAAADDKAAAPLKATVSILETQQERLKQALAGYKALGQGGSEAANQVRNEIALLDNAIARARTGVDQLDQSSLDQLQAALDRSKKQLASLSDQGGATAQALKDQIAALQTVIGQADPANAPKVGGGQDDRNRAMQETLAQLNQQKQALQDALVQFKALGDGGSEGAKRVQDALIQVTTAMEGVKTSGGDLDKVALNKLQETIANAKKALGDLGDDGGEAAKKLADVLATVDLQLKKAGTATGDLVDRSTSGQDDTQEALKKTVLAIRDQEDRLQKLKDSYGQTGDEGKQAADEVARQIEVLEAKLAGARDEARRLGDALRDLPARGSYQTFEPRDQFRGGEPVEGGAAGGVMATRPGLVLFGEGGQPEVGGPASFFREIFEKIASEGGGGRAAGGPTNVTLNMPVMPSYDMRWLTDQFIPLFRRALRTEGDMVTDLKAAVGAT